MSPKPSEDGNRNNLPRSLYIQQRDPRANLREMVASVFSDKLMIFLSLILIPIILLPFIFQLNTDILFFFEICDWIIVVLFVAEYALKLYAAQNRWSHFKSAWHIVDLIIIILPFMQYLPTLDLAITGSPSLLLRLLRLPRALAVGGRVIASRRGNEIAQKQEIPDRPVNITNVAPDFTVSENLSWDDLKAHLADEKTPEWFDLNYVSDEGFAQLSSILGIPEPHFKSALVDEIYPHIDYVQKASFIFVQSGRIRYPAENAVNYLTIARSGIIVICNGKKIITVSRRNSDLLDAVLKAVQQRGKTAEFVVPVLHGVLEHILNDYRSVLSEMELELLQISTLPRSKLPKDYLVRIYQMDKEVSRLVSNLVHFKDMLTIITSKKVALDGFDDPSEEEAFHVLQDSASYLNEIAHDLIENLRSNIDLYINQTSFEANKILKILAVITAISVVPTAVSGILGTNMIDTPYGASLWQLSFVVSVCVGFIAYTFVKLGWLKT
ncbi:MAG TPA: CorA family divalent cation transporter [Candidatus Acidoferrales bacterium]|nr:CorA family divalent cation transporter [Candidatus Acidoferrales bacterium]